MLEAKFTPVMLHVCRADLSECVVVTMQSCQSVQVLAVPRFQDPVFSEFDAPFCSGPCREGQRQRKRRVNFAHLSSFHSSVIYRVLWRSGHQVAFSLSGQTAEIEEDGEGGGKEEPTPILFKITGILVYKRKMNRVEFK